MIRVEGLRAGYYAGFSRRWREVLAGISFHVPRGSVTGYLGVNGAGKTTTIKVLVGINPPAGGSVQIAGHAAGSAAAQRQLGYFPEAPFFYDGLSALELLDHLGRLSGLDRAGRRRRADALLDEVGLADAKQQPVKGFSKGMRQRLGLAQALIHEPALLLLDEPLDGLDPMGRLQLREQIAAQAAKGTTIFFSSHVLSDVEAVADHLVVLDAGAVAYDGSTAAFSEGARPLRLRYRPPEEGAAELAEALAALGQVEARDGAAVLTCADTEAANAALQQTLAAGAVVLELEQVRPSLEQTFMDRFGGAKADA